MRFVRLPILLVLTAVIGAGQVVYPPGFSGGGGSGGSGGAGGQFSIPSAAYAAGTFFLAPGGGLPANATETNVQARVGVAGNVSNFTAKLPASPGAGVTVTYTWRLDPLGVGSPTDQTVTCSISGAVATSCADITHSFAVALTDLIDIKMVVSGGTLTSAMVLTWGLPGAVGPTGAPGSAATVAAGTTTTGAPGSSALVTNSGTSSAAIFNFTIPRGDVGAAGTNGTNGTNGTGYTATSTSSLVTAGSGSKTFATQTNLAYSVGARIRATSVGTGEYMEGLVTSYSGSTLIATMDLNSGTGTHADWNINLAGNVGQAGAVGPAGPVGSSAVGNTTFTSGTPVTITHNLGSQNIAGFSLLNHSTFESYSVAWSAPTINTITFTPTLTVGAPGVDWTVSLGGGGGSGGSGYNTIDSNGTPVTARTTVNFISGTNSTVNCVDNSGASRTDCTVSSTGGGGGGTVTSVSSANADIGIINPTTTPQFTLNSSTTPGANKIPKLDGSGNLTIPIGTVNIGSTGVSTGTINILGSTSGTVSITAANAAGTWVFQVPTSGGSSGQVLTTNGSGTTTWSSPTATNLNGGATNQVPYQSAASTTAFSTHLTYTDGTQTLAVGGTVSAGAVGNATGVYKINGTTSGTVTITGAAAAGTWTFQVPTTAGTSGQFLQTNGSGVAIWATAGGSISGLTNNKLTKATSSTTIGDSSITDDGTTIAATEPFTTTGTIQTGVGSGLAGANAMSQGTLPTFGAGSGQVPTTGYNGWSGSVSGVTNSYLGQLPVAVPTANNLLLFPAPTSGLSQSVWLVLATGINTFLATPSSANLAAAITDETGAGPLMFATAPAVTNPTIVTGSSLAASASSGFSIPGTSLTAGSIYYQASGGLTVAKADVSTTVPAVCLAVSTTQCLTYGVFRFSATQSWTAGQLLYVSDATGGAILNSAPTTSGHFVQRIGVALAADTIQFMPSIDVGGIQ